MSFPLKDFRLDVTEFFVPSTTASRVPLALADMDDETLESAAILAAMTHRMTGSREAYDRLRDINAERRRRRAVAC